MKKTIVIYYSKTGNNRYLAEKIATRLDCDIEEIKPNVSAMFFLIIQLGMGIKKLKHSIESYDRVILCGPIWMGTLIYPLKHFVEKYIAQIKKIVFVTTCASGIETKNHKYGYAKVFKKLKFMAGDKCSHCEAFPVPLVMPHEDRKSFSKVMNTRLSDDNFTGRIVEQLDRFILNMP